jgi:DNA-binding PadR family transcriptional regulator
MATAGMMTATGVLDLAILGVVSEGATTSETIVGVVKRIGGGKFRPTAEVIDNRIGALLEAGCLTPLEAGKWPGRVELSAVGRSAIQRLLHGSTLAPGEALGSICQTLRVCLLELLPPELRREVLGEAIAANRRELAHARAALERCPCQCRFVERCLARDVERWEAELLWLEDLEVDLAVWPAHRPTRRSDARR